MIDIVSIDKGNSLYIDGFQANNYDGSLGLWLISPGRCRDSRNIIDIELISNSDEEADFDGILVTNQFSGVGGVDIVNSINLSNVLYAIYVIADSYGNKPVASLCSVSTYGYIPALPSGYDSYRLIGYVKSSSEGKFNEDTANVGKSNDRQVVYLNNQHVVSIPSSTLLEVPLLNTVPCIDNLIVTLDVNYTGLIQTDSLKISSVNNVLKTYIFLQTQIPSAKLNNQYDVACPINQSTGVPSFFYITGLTDLVGIFLEKFYFTV